MQSWPFVLLLRGHHLGQANLSDAALTAQWERCAWLEVANGSGGMLRKSVLALIAVLAVFPGPDTKAHKHVESGEAVSWYPHDCCHDGDCRPVRQIVRTPHGLWMTTVDGQTVLVGPNNRRLPSRDLRWHVYYSRH